MTVFKYDVFISYSHKNNEWVRGTLLPKLKEHGLKVWIDFENLPIGAPVLTTIEKALVESRKVCLIFTESYLTSEWCEFENLLPQTKHPTNKGFQIVPVFLEKCDLPPRFGALNYVNFVDKDEFADPWERLLTALESPIEFKKTPKIASRADWALKHPYGETENFTGRDNERKMLTDWLTDDKHPLLVLRALGGFGKSALTWHWINNDLSPADFPKVLWWSFYDEKTFGNFLGETLEYLTGEPAPKSPVRTDVEKLLNELERTGILLVLDGFERALRAYESMDAPYQEDGEEKEHDTRVISPLAEYFLAGISTLPAIKSKVLMTTRLTPKILFGHDDSLLKGCAEKELNALDKADAVHFFQRLGIKGTRAELEAACKSYGYHPLSLRLLGGLIVKDFENPRDIVVAQRVNVIGALRQRQHHVLQLAYDALSPERQKLFSRISCFRGAMDFKALQAIAEDAETFQDDLHDFIERGLINHTEETNTFDLHPIVRRYAYERLTAPDRTAAHTRLRDYFEAVPKPEKVESLNDLAPVIELYHHMVRAGQFDEAAKLYYQRINDIVYYQFGAYQNAIELLGALFTKGTDQLPQLEEEAWQAWSLNELANAYSLNGEPRRAVPLNLRNVEYDEQNGRKKHLAIGLGNVADPQLKIGALGEAERNLRRRIDLCREIEDEFNEAIGHRELGRTLAYRGLWAEAEQALDEGLRLFEKEQVVQSQGVVTAYRSLRALLMARENPKDKRKVLQSAIQHAQRALELVNEQAKDIPVERDYVEAHWLLGASYRANGDLEEADPSTALRFAQDAERHLSESLRRCRAINLVMDESDILLEVSKLRHAQNEPEEAIRLAQEALVITERSGYVLQGADVNLWLAELALEGVVKRENVKREELAREYAEKALKLAYCDDGPPWHYKVAYDEAQALLKELGE